MATKLEVEFELKYKEAVKNLDEFQKEYAKLQKEVVKANKQTADALKKVEKSAEDGGKGIQKVGLSIKNLAKGVGVIYILQKAFEFVKKAIEDNQQIMDAINIAFETASILFNQVADAVLSNTENFDALGRIMSNLLTIALTPIKLAFNGIKAALLGAQLAWEQSWFGGGDEEKIASLKEQLKEVGDEVVEIGKNVIEAGGNIVNDFGEAVGEISNIASEVTKAVSDESIKAATETAKANIQLKKSADIARVANQGLIEQYDREAEQQRQIRDNDLKSIDDRIEANNKLQDILILQKEKMLENAKAIEIAAQAQFDLTGKDEDYIALLEAKNEKKAVEAQIEGFISEQEANRVALLKEKMELELSNDEATAIRQSEQRAFNAEMEQNEVTRMQMFLDNLTLESEAEALRLEQKRDTYAQGTQAYIDANNELLTYQQNNANEQERIERDLANAKLNMAKNTLGNIAKALGENSKAGKAAAAASALINTYQGITAELATKTTTPWGFALKLINIATTAAIGFKSVKDILKTDPKGTASAGSATTPSSGRGTTAPEPVPPAFNIVGASGTNQLADAIGGQTQQPVQAFVVASDVTTAQGLERNTIEGATIG